MSSHLTEPQMTMHLKSFCNPDGPIKSVRSLLSRKGQLPLEGQLPQGRSQVPHFAGSLQPAAGAASMLLWVQKYPESNLMSLYRLVGHLHRTAASQTTCQNLFVRAMTSSADVERKLRDKLKAEDVVCASISMSAFILAC